MHLRKSTSRHCSLALISAAIALSTAATPSNAGHHGERGKTPRVVGQFSLLDDTINLAGGALLNSDCTQSGGLVGAIPLRDQLAGQFTIVKFNPLDWVNNPDPNIPPYSSWAVPAEMPDEPLIFVCYEVEHITGYDLRNWPPGVEKPFILEALTDGGTFCDWIPRNSKGLLDIDITGDFTPDIHITTEYRGIPHLCSDGWDVD